MLTKFKLSAWDSIPVTVGDGIDLDEERLMAFPAFQNWLVTLRANLEKQKSAGHTFEKEPWRLNAIKVHSVHPFDNGKLGFMTIEAFLEKKNNHLERVIFLRGGSVAVLMILRPKDAPGERYVILTEQPRIGACSTGFLEIPAGMLDDESGNVTGKAMKEIREETGLTVQGKELIDMTALALENAESKEGLQPAMYPSPANLDEYIPILLWEKTMDRKQIDSLKGRLTGERVKDDELITLRVSDYNVLWREGARDAKTLAAWALYEGLNRAGKIEEKMKEIRLGRSKR